MEIKYAPDVFRTAVKVATQTILKNQVAPTDGHLLFLVDGQGRVAFASARSSIAFLKKPDEFSWDSASQMCIQITDMVDEISEKALKYNVDVAVDIEENRIGISMYSTATGLLETKCPVVALQFSAVYMFKGMVQGKVRDATCSNPYLSLKMLKLLSGIPRRRNAPKEKDALHIANVPGCEDMFIITPDWMINSYIFLAGLATRGYNGRETPMLVGQPI